MSLALKDSHLQLSLNVFKWEKGNFSRHDSLLTVNTFTCFISRKRVLCICKRVNVGRKHMQETPV